ncbi:LxmA leader domain family RiPP [Streptomyces leeuwenhoekii]|jgi:hypothetical protein|uniref:Uncharacterized protein n=1 Tax=Streptomyces leeuwenhoekii TaxID=1437453 RepID=A0A0F7W844_STRLW|nr:MULTISPECIES: LxmA leader domain family RiPP [Streptomyces]CQR66067.1 Hypothetical Protein sle_66130 [Streptomyces leeuwenhoekii]
MDTHELIEGFDAYVEAEELNEDAMVDAPATTVPCTVASFATGYFSC